MAEISIDNSTRYLDNEQPHDSFGDKVRREGSLLGNGILGVKDAALNGLSREHIGETALTATASAAVGLGLAYLARGRGLGYVASRGIGLVAGLTLAKDCLSMGGDAAGAMANSWRSDNTFEDDKKVMHDKVGHFTFDLGLASAGAFGGAAAGNRLFRPYIPEPFLSQFNKKTGITEDYYNAFGANEMRMMMLQGEANLPPKVLAEWRSELPTAIRNTESYSQYWDRQIATHQQYHPTETLDRRGIHNALVRSYPNADKLNTLVSELRAFGDQDLSNPDIIKGVSSKFQQARTIIYGADNAHQTRALF
jgi:hypothetical protein